MKKLSTYVAFIALLLLMGCYGNTLFFTQFPKTYFTDYFPVKSGDTLTYVCHKKNDTTQFYIIHAAFSYDKNSRHGSEWASYQIEGTRINDKREVSQEHFTIDHNLLSRKDGTIYIYYEDPGIYKRHEEGYWDYICCSATYTMNKSFRITDEEQEKDKDAIFQKDTNKIERGDTKSCVSGTIVNKEGIVGFVDSKGNYYELLK